MTPEEREALLASYALGTLSAPDAIDAERLVRSDEDAAAEYETYRELADLIALSVPLRRADPSLRQRVIAAARSDRPRWRRGIFQRRHLPMAGLAAALMIVAVWAVSLQQSIDSLREQSATLTAIVEAEVKRTDTVEMANAAISESRTLGNQLEQVLRDQQAILQVQADPDAYRIDLQQTSASHGAAGQYLWSDQANAGIALVQHMPPLPVGSNYKVWLEDRLGNIVLASTFTPDEQGNAQVVLQHTAGAEPVHLYVIPGATGSGSREGPIVLQAELDREAAAATPEPTDVAESEGEDGEPGPDEVTGTATP